MRDLSELNRLHAIEGMARTFIADVIAKGRASIHNIPPARFLEAAIGQRQAGEYIQKTAQGAMTAGDPPAVNPFGTAFLGLLKAISAFDSLSWMPAPPYTRVGIDSGTGHEAATVVEGDPIPVLKLTADIAPITPLKRAIIMALTRELVDAGTSDAEQQIGRRLTRAIAAGTDKAAFDPTESTSLTNGATEIGTTGTPADDIKAIVGAISGGIPSAPALVLGAGAARELVFSGNDLFRNVALVGRGSIGGIPTFTSISAYLSHLAIAVDVDAVMVADQGVEVDLSRNASIVMDDAPGGGAQQLVSAWQTNTIVYRALRYLGWRKRADAVAFVDIGVSAA